MNKKKTFFVLGLILFLGAAWFVKKSYFPSECAVCQRAGCKILSVSMKGPLGLPVKVCCPQCALTYQGQHQRAGVESVTDFTTGKKIDPDNAFYLVGSHVVLCHPPESVSDRLHGTVAYPNYDRCFPSVIAFSEKEDAVQFQRNQGGQVYSFAELASRSRQQASMIH